MHRSISVLLALLVAAPIPAAATGASYTTVAAHTKASSKTAASKPGATKTLPDGLRYTDVVVGKGAMPRPGQTAIVHYTGTFPDGKKFDSSRDRHQPFDFPLGAHRVIPCWDEGVATMRVGGRRTLICPPSLAYGAAGAGGVIPPNATLHFDVELLGVK